MPAPSPKSLQLAKKFDILDQLFSSKDAFLKSSGSYLVECEATSVQDDGPYHVFRAWKLVREFHASYYFQSEFGEDHFLPALQALTRVCELMPQSDESFMDNTGVSFAFHGGVKVARQRPGVKSLKVLEKLWRDLGGAVRDTWGEQDPDYQGICNLFGKPGKRPTVKEAVAALKRVKKCESCGKAGLMRCGKCHLLTYCSRECQQIHWRSHKKQCV